MIKAMNKQGVVRAAEETMKEIGEKNESDPHAIYEAML